MSIKRKLVTYLEKEFFLENPGESKIRIGAATSSKEIGLITIWFTNADVLTQDKIRELKEEIKIDRAPDIAITELKPKNYTRQLTENEYEIGGYKFEQENLMDKGSTRGVAMYIKKSLMFLRLKASQIIGTNGNAPREVMTIEIKLTKNGKLLLSNVYRSPRSLKTKI